MSGVAYVQDLRRTIPVHKFDTISAAGRSSITYDLNLMQYLQTFPSLANARPYYQAQEQQAKQAGDIARADQALGTLTAIDNMLGNYEQEVRDGLQRVAYAKQLSGGIDTHQLADAYSQLAFAQSDVGDYAERVWRKIYPDDNTYDFQASEMARGNAFVGLHRYAEAQRAFENGMAIDQRISNGRNAPAFLLGLHNVATGKGDYAQALAYDKQGIALQKTLDDTTSATLGQFYYAASSDSARLRVWADVLSYAAASIAVYTRLAGSELNVWIAANYDLIAQADTALGHATDARAAQAKAAAIRQTLK